MTHDTTVYNRFSQWDSPWPDDVAVAEDGRSLSYRELYRMDDSVMSKFYGRVLPVVMKEGGVE